MLSLWLMFYCIFLQKIVSLIRINFNAEIKSRLSRFLKKENPEICENAGNFEDTMLSKMNQSQGDKYG